MDNGIWIAVIAIFTASIPAYIAGRFAYRQFKDTSDTTRETAKITAEQTKEIEIIKAETIKDIELTKAATEKETKRIDQAMNLQQKIIDRQDAHVVRLEGRVDKLTADMHTCIEERSKFKVRADQIEALLKATEVQMKSNAKFYDTSGLGKSQLKGEIKGEIKPE